MAQLIPDGTYIITSASNGKLVELQNASPTGNFIMVSKPEEQTLPSKQKVVIQFASGLYNLSILPATSAAPAYASNAKAVKDDPVSGSTKATSYEISAYQYASDQFFIKESSSGLVWTVANDDKVLITSQKAADSQRWMFTVVQA